MARKRRKSTGRRSRGTSAPAWAGIRKVLKQAIAKVPVIKEVIGAVDADDRLALDKTLLRRLDRIAKAIGRSDSNLQALVEDVLEELRSGRNPSHILRPMKLKLGELRNPASLLHARYGVAPFLWDAREKERDELEAWCGHDATCSARLFVGPGGTGKTRLFIEWADELRQRGWHAGFLPGRVSCEDIGLLCGADRPVLVIVDYVENHRHLVELMEGCAARPDGNTAPLRIALLTRQAGDWCAALSAHSLDVESLMAQSDPLALEHVPLDSDLRQRMFREACEAFAEKKGEQPAPPPSVPLEDVLFERPLFIQMAALAAVDGLDLSARSLVEGILRHEISYARKWQTGGSTDLLEQEVSSVAAGRVLAAIALRGGAATHAEAAKLNAALDGPGDHFVERLHWLYPDESTGAYIRPMEPDLIGEALVRETLAHPEIPDDFLDRALDGAAEAGLEHCVTLLGRCASSGELELPGTRGILYSLEGRIPKRTLSLRELAVLLNQKLLTFVQTDSEDTEQLSEYCRLCNNLGSRLSDLGRREEALAATQEAVEHYRSLAETRPDAFLPGLATSLNNLGNSLSDLGRYEEALAATQEAVDIRRGLAEKRPDAFLPYLATGLNNLGTMLSDLGRYEEALAATQEAVELTIPLTVQRPRVFGRKLKLRMQNMKRLAECGIAPESNAVWREARELLDKLGLG
ncbi:MAG: tetratricopeptide repeat protein [Planctomycetota bacterium]